jgi:hypothetical protein
MCPTQDQYSAKNRRYDPIIRDTIAISKRHYTQCDTRESSLPIIVDLRYDKRNLTDTTHRDTLLFETTHARLDCHIVTHHIGTRTN